MTKFDFVQTALDPPFDKNVSSLALLPSVGHAASQDSASSSLDLSQLDDLLPASIRNEDALELPSAAHLDSELNLRRLDKIYEYLWLAGRPMPPRPLHYQQAASREIIVVEKMDLHLVWEPNRIYLKPLPRYLLSYNFWSDNLVCKPGCCCPSLVTGSGIDPSNKTPSSAETPCSQPSLPLNSKQQSIGQIDRNLCPQHQLYQCAFGFLLSYVALIQYESDFHIAQSAFLLPETVTWATWKELVRQLLNEKNRKRLPNKRFLFGELRLNRLNMIYGFRFGNLRGYRFGYQTYGTFFQDHLAPIVSFIVYVTIVLTAMQVGLATDRLGENEIFQQASYGFTVFSILSPLVLVGLIFCWFLVLFVNNLFATLSFKKKRLAHNHQPLPTV